MPVDLKFGYEYIDAIHAGEKTSTGRYDLEREVRPGDDLRLRDEEGEVIGEAVVDMVSTNIPVREYVQIVADQESNTGRYLDQLRRHYPGAVIGPETPITGISWAAFEPREAYWREDRYAEVR